MWNIHILLKIRYVPQMWFVEKWVKTAQGCTLQPARHGQQAGALAGVLKACVAGEVRTHPWVQSKGWSVVHIGRSGPLLSPPPHHARTVGMSVFLLYHLHGSQETKSVSWAVKGSKGPAGQWAESCGLGCIEFGLFLFLLIAFCCWLCHV